MFTRLRKLGFAVRRAIATVRDLDEVARDLAGPHRCALCGEPTEPGNRRWSPGRKAFIDSECIPAYILRRGETAVREWLETS